MGRPVGIRLRGILRYLPGLELVAKVVPGLSRNILRQDRRVYSISVSWVVSTQPREEVRWLTWLVQASEGPADSVIARIIRL